MTQTRRTTQPGLPSTGLYEASQRSSGVWIILLVVSLGHLLLLLEGFAVPGFFRAADYWLSTGLLVFMAGLLTARWQRWVGDARLLSLLVLGNAVFLLAKLVYALFWVGTAGDIMTELATTTIWSLTMPMLVALLRGNGILRWLGLLAPMILALLGLLFLDGLDERLRFSFAQLGLAGGLVFLASRFISGIWAEFGESRLENQNLSRLAFFDDLTGLNNRTFLDQRLHELCRAGEPVAVLFADLDGFKGVNDSLGHAAGDEVLRILAARLKEMGHATACLARVSGDEFVVVLSNRSRQEVATFADWMVRELSRPIRLEGQELRLSVSVGISLYPRDATEGHELLLQADRAMYAVKRTGKNGHRFYADHLLGLDEPRHLIEQELRHARERGELSLMFQPICDIGNGAPHTIEVLMRWNSRALGRVGPDVFIPIAEENGLIGSLGEWALTSALAAAQVWQAEGFDNLRVAVNVSPLQLMQVGFVDMVEATLENYGLPPSILELEVTEGVDLHERTQVMYCLQRLRDLGVIISLDDFGTGFASLSRLNELPVQVVKIDRVFVNDLTAETHEDRARYVRTLISAMVGVASSLQLKLVVEGVETEQQRHELRALGCRLAQGYLFAKPMTEDELRGRLWADNWQMA